MSLGAKRMIQISGAMMFTGITILVSFPYFVPSIIGFVAEGYTLRVAFALIALMGLVVIFLSGRVQKQV
jgi:ABC-type Zn2+ transport system substrate-binding protein/surface adhesin